MSVTQSRGLLGKRYGSYHYRNGTYGGIPGIMAGSESYYTTPGGSQTTTSFRTSKSSTGAEQYENLSTRELRHQVIYESRNKYDTGHNFETEKKENDITSGNSRLISHPSGFQSYHGPIWFEIDRVLSNPYPSYTLPSSIDIDLAGSRAIEATAPTAPQAGMAQFLGELREKLPQLTGLQTLRNGLTAESIGSEHLNIEFGIKPLIGDIQKLAQSVLNFRKIVEQFQRDAGVNNVVRRRRHLGDDYSTTVVAEAMPIPYSITPLSGTVDPYYYFENTTAVVRVIDSIRQSAWFSGAFSYHLAQADSFLGKLESYEQLANQLLGSRFGVDTVWELTPWSWLIDWNVDVGGFFHNIELLHNDSLVLRYGYVMHETRAERIYTATQPIIDRAGQNGGVPIAYFSYHRKKRTKATPYGFGLDIQAFSPRRWAILAALGMTKSGGKLRSDGD